MRELRASVRKKESNALGFKFAIVTIAFSDQAISISVFFDQVVEYGCEQQQQGENKRHIPIQRLQELIHTVECQRPGDHTDVHGKQCRGYCFIIVIG